ncbi:hypothetical protein G7054_g4169 [Neopestalotiopsis clavispora]|nr:hypothetical protein G7054_g4169 [Neopestalotiopsis clavispora]
MESEFTNLGPSTFVDGRSRMSGRKGPRRREALSCSECRLRKGRCDRALPCQPCQARGLTCSYTPAKKNVLQVVSQSPVVARASRLIAQSTSTSFSEASGTTAHSPISNSPSSTVVVSPSSSQQLDQKPGPNKGSLFRGSGLSTRLMGVSNWMAPANDMPIIKALLDRSSRFESCKTGIADLQALFDDQALQSSGHSRVPCRYNAQTLRALLPQRQTCEKWIAHYNRTYGRIYSIMDPSALVSDLDRIFSPSLTSDEPVHVLRVMLVAAIGSWHVNTARDAARGLVRQAEDCIYHSTQFQTIMASESDRIHDLLALRGLTHQIVISMGLHRDPIYFTNVTPYYAEVRRRLWSCYVRLDLDYCFRSGTPLTLRHEDSDCPLPTLMSLASYDGHPESRLDSNDLVAEDDQFGLAMAKLAVAIAPAIQAFGSPSPRALFDIEGRVRSSLDEIVSELPEKLRVGHPTADYTQFLQQTIIAISTQSVKLSFALALILGHLPGADMPSRELLLDTWDQALCILQHFQAVCQNPSHNEPELVNVAYHLLWTDACRAALAACLIVNHMKDAHLRHTDQPKSRPSPTIIALQQLLLQYVQSLGQFFEVNSHRGITAAETRVLFAVLTTMTKDADMDSSGPNREETLTAACVTAAEKAIADIKQKLDAGGQRLIAFPEEHMLSGIFSRQDLPPSPFSWPEGSVPLEEPDISMNINNSAGFILDSGYESSMTTGLGFDFTTSLFQKATNDNLYLDEFP